MASRDPIRKIQRRVSNFRRSKKPRVARYFPYTAPVVDFSDEKYGAWGGKLNPWNWFAGSKPQPQPTRDEEQEDFYDEDYYPAEEDMTMMPEYEKYSFDDNFMVPVSPGDKVQSIFDPISRRKSTSGKKKPKPVTIF